MELLTILYALLAATIGLGGGDRVSSAAPVSAACQQIVITAESADSAQPVAVVVGQPDNDVQRRIVRAVAPIEAMAPSFARYARFGRLLE